MEYGPLIYAYLQSAGVPTASTLNQPEAGTVSLRSPAGSPEAARYDSTTTVTGGHG
jgi:hypothetical protein